MAAADVFLVLEIAIDEVTCATRAVADATAGDSEMIADAAHSDSVRFTRRPIELLLLDQLP